MISETEQKLFETTGGPAVPDGWQLVPEDLVTHLHDFEEACRIAKTHAVVFPPDIDDRSYWDKQITTIAKVRAALEAQTQEKVDAEQRGVGIGMAIAAGIVMRVWGRDEYAREILGAAGLETLEKLTASGVDQYDIDALMPVVSTASEVEG